MHRFAAAYTRGIRRRMIFDGAREQLRASKPGGEKPAILIFMLLMQRPEDLWLQGLTDPELGPLRLQA
jgi:hypothetical protein